MNRKIDIEHTGDGVVVSEIFPTAQAGIEHKRAREYGYRRSLPLWRRFIAAVADAGRWLKRATGGALSLKRLFTLLWFGASCIVLAIAWRAAPDALPALGNLAQPALVFNELLFLSCAFIGWKHNKTTLGQLAATIATICFLVSLYAIVSYNLAGTTELGAQNEAARARQLELKGKIATQEAFRDSVIVPSIELLEKRADDIRKQAPGEDPRCAEYRNDNQAALCKQIEGIQRQITSAVNLQTERDTYEQNIVDAKTELEGIKVRGNESIDALGEYFDNASAWVSLIFSAIFLLSVAGAGIIRELLP
tara:strand:+ start:5441 stop:6361 length:921 start_codon:yes stop_codon:yes gene_type:complete